MPPPLVFTFLQLGVIIIFGASLQVLYPFSISQPNLSISNPPTFVVPSTIEQEFEPFTQQIKWLVVWPFILPALLFVRQ